MKKEMNFFQSLRKKLETKPDRNFDQHFWNTFEREFGAAPEKRNLFLRFARLFPATAVAGVLVALFAYQRTVTEPAKTGAVTEVAAFGLGEDTEMVQDLEFFAEIDDLMLSATDEDWDVLLETGNDSET